MHAAEKIRLSSNISPPLTPWMVEPSAPQFPPPSYDVVAMGIQGEFGDNKSTSSSSHRRTPSGTGGWQDPSVIEAEPLVEPRHPHPAASPQADNSLYANSLSRREFLSSLEYEKTCNGSYSSDPWINTDPVALLRFINECNDRPHLVVKIQGSYTHFKDVESIVTPENGEPRKVVNKVWENIVDFDCSLDMSAYIEEKGTLHAARKEKRYIEQYDIHELLYSYIAAENFLKEFRVDKKVIWDYELVKRELRALIKSTGYPNNITIEFPLENDRIVVRSHRTMAKVWRHPATHPLCFIACACLISFLGKVRGHLVTYAICFLICACLIGFLMEYFATKQWRDKLKSNFVISTSPKDFADHSSALIFNKLPSQYRTHRMYPPYPTAYPPFPMPYNDA
ncbi:hypothetical protein LPJ66_004630 [Kickxella alabastrina]|uniref:Uncharacterized protein n=1 Tax=Kickxella alabastrina TaxID=61397 RepID=A0ACC1II63_9FUNG|nr:hypothetical protein LPJ66_004630 [Kickxella alabastrina]